MTALWLVENRRLDTPGSPLESQGVVRKLCQKVPLTATPLSSGDRIRTTGQNPDNNASFNSRGAKCSAFSAQTSVDDADLETLTDAWPDLPPPIKAAILALVRVAVESEER
jgi:hypothetical protein